MISSPTSNRIHAKAATEPAQSWIRECYVTFDSLRGIAILLVFGGIILPPLETKARSGTSSQCAKRQQSVTKWHGRDQFAMISQYP
jgi:hypothetical protein